MTITIRRWESRDFDAAWSLIETLDVAYLASLSVDADSTSAYVRSEERDAWRAVARGEKPFVDEDVHHVKIDPARYAATFGFDP